jgi:hypothetical protein
MVVPFDIEIRAETNISPKERAEARDAYVREFERQFNDWVGIAKCCADVERDRDWELLGFPSWHAWILDAAPRSRSYIYLVVGRFKELSIDIPEEELALIPLGSAGVLTKLSSSARRDSKIRKSAQQKPEKFVADLQQIAPQQHLEAMIRKEVFFTASQWAVIEPKFEAYCLLDPGASLATFIEFLVSECQ